MPEQSNATQTIKQLFQRARAIRIPAYQRAYSWEIEHCEQFLADILDRRGKRYYLGQLLFEQADDTYFIIDGQ